MKIDIHIHSAGSHDCRTAPEDLINAAKKAGLDGIAICDHDHFYDGPIPDDFILLRGCEFSTPYGHLLGINLKNAVEPAPIEQLIRQIHAQGGLAILAHPYEHLRYREQIEKIAPLLDGVEVFNARACRKNKAANRQAMAFAKRYALPIFGGSDAHTLREIGNGYTILSSIDELARGGQVVCGRNSPHFCTAQSQWVRLRKKRSSILHYMRWFLFAAKCLMEDGFIKKEKQYVTYRKDW